MKKYMNWAVRVVLFWAVLLLFVRCSSREEDSHESGKNSQIRVEALEYSLLPTGERIITGALKNETRVPISGAQIQVSLFDRTNRRIGSMSFVVRDIGPGERKAFREPVNEAEDVRGARVRSVIVL